MGWVEDFSNHQKLWMPLQVLSTTCKVNTRWNYIPRISNGGLNKAVLGEFFKIFISVSCLFGTQEELIDVFKANVVSYLAISKTKHIKIS